MICTYIVLTVVFIAPVVSKSPGSYYVECFDCIDIDLIG